VLAVVVEVDVFVESGSQLHLRYILDFASEPTTITTTRKIRFEEVKLEIGEGPLMLRQLDCWVHEVDLKLSLAVGLSVLNQFEYSMAELLTETKSRSWELSCTPSVRKH
jgi:hypothetical protein